MLRGGQHLAAERQPGAPAGRARPGGLEHWLRHAHASHALDRGAPLHLEQATLGHADLKVTGRYAHARLAESSATYLVG